MIKDDYKHVVSKATDCFGKTFYYCHMKAFPTIPVFGSIGSYQKAKAVADQFNVAYKEKKDV